MILFEQAKFHSVHVQDCIGLFCNLRSEYFVDISVDSSVMVGLMFLFSFTGKFQSADIPETLVKTLLDEVGLGIISFTSLGAFIFIFPLLLVIFACMLFSVFVCVCVCVSACVCVYVCI